MDNIELKKFIESVDFEKVVKDLYCSDEKDVIEKQRDRYIRTLNEIVDLYGDGDYHIISSPGRVEIGGNHTDHQLGNVVAASISIDNLCFVKKTNDNVVIFTDKTFGENKVDLNDLSIKEDEKGNTKSILRGVASRYRDLGYQIGGFTAYQDMNVLVGSGLSSSACFEILVTEIYNYLYNDDKIGAIERAIISRWVENIFFGKPCGLMDQMAISVGGFVGIDFSKEGSDMIEKEEFSFNDYGYQLLVINTKANHADLTAEYSAIPNEMKSVAKYFGVDVLSKVDEKEFYKNIKKIRNDLKNDRAVLRAYHYFDENKRAIELTKALKNKDINLVLDIMKKSGDSSYKYLQNVYASSDVKNQGVAISIAMSEKFIKDNGICRVQGGGFAGTIQAIVKKEKVDEYIDFISEIFGEDSVISTNIRSSGTKLVI